MFSQCPVPFFWKICVAASVAEQKGKTAGKWQKFNLVPGKASVTSYMGWL